MRRRSVLHSIAMSARPELAPLPEPSTDARADATAYLLRPVGALLRCILIGVGVALATWAFLDSRVNVLSIAAAVAGLALVVRIVADSETVHNWVEWLAELHFARELSAQQWERQRQIWQHAGNAAAVSQALSTAPSEDDRMVNDTIADILRRYYEMKAAHDPRLSKVKLWSDRQIAATYGFGRQATVTRRICEAIEKIADGYKLRPHTYVTAYQSLFGVVPERVHRLVRVGDNPSTGEAVFIPSPTGAQVVAGRDDGDGR